MRIRATTRHEPTIPVRYRGLSAYYWTYVVSSLILVVTIGLGCANKDIQQHFPKPDYAKSRQMTVIQAEDADILPAESSGPQWEYALYLANMGLLGPGGIQQMTDGYGKKGWELITVLNPTDQEGASSTWLLFFFKKPLSSDNTD